MKAMLAEAREIAWKEVNQTKDKVSLGADLLEETEISYNTHMIPIETLASAFCGVVEAYDSSDFDLVEGHFETHETLQRDLIEARKSVDQAIIFAKRLQRLVYNELDAA
jgi:hypothetical protein